jgi:redox-sensitive bicupin YhaK (pirin superfamily)
MALKTFPLGFPWDTADPFLFCVHHLDHYPRGNADLGPDASLEGRPLGNDFTLKEGWRMYHGHTVPGFPSHPHRGFETITIVTRGYCDHSDSLGAAARFGQGDVQWMTAGRGVQHSEMFPLLDPSGPNTLELFQIWLNLPRERKLVEPHFKMLWDDSIPRVTGPGWELRLIAGTVQGVTAPAPPPDSWAATPENDVVVALVTLEPGAVLEIPEGAPGSHRRIFLFEGGGLSAEGHPLRTGQGAELPEKSVKVTCGTQACRFLWLQGKPISEPVAKYGPFVMNDPEELNRAVEEYRLTQFGGWPWPYPDHVHPKEKGRFAQYPDGSLTEK